MSNFILLFSLSLSFIVVYNPYISIISAILLVIGLALRLRTHRLAIISASIFIALIHTGITVLHMTIFENGTIYYVSQMITYSMMFVVFFISARRSMAKALSVFEIVILMFYLIVMLLAQDANLPEIALDPIATVTIFLGAIIVMIAIIIFIQERQSKNEVQDGI